MDAVRATYYIESSFPVKRCAEIIAMEESTGTWTEVHTTEGKDLDFVTAKVEDVDEIRGKAVIAYPVDLFEVRNIPQLLSVVAGNLFGLSDVANVRLLDLEFPNEFISQFRGPAFGIDGVRDYIGTKEDGRPHVGTIIKPKVGLNPEETAAVAYEAASGGIDLIKDDETLCDQRFCPMAERLPLVMDAIDRALSEVEERTLYAVNVTTGADEIAERADIAEENGANMLMIDVITAGFDALKVLRENCSLPIHVHRTMHGALTRNPAHGIAMDVFCRLTRLIGGDQLHVGTLTGKMEGEETNILHLDSILKEEWHGFKPVFPVSSGGLHPGCVEEEIGKRGMDLVLQAGGGVHGHPYGTKAGARAMRQAAEAMALGVGLEAHAAGAPELSRALETWGIGKIENYYR